jgi:hydroxymethylglutaryl-CoA reductase (NADPH)
MGMNMVTIATEAAVQLILQNVANARCVAVSGNLCSDKKESALNTLMGRGKSVTAEVVVPADVLGEVLHTEAGFIVDINQRKNLLGSALAGSSKFNTHFANIVAAVFLATGQDIAQVVESSGGFTWVESRDGDLYFSVTLPSLEVGTIGGGADLTAQREALSLLGVAGGGDPPGGNARKFAEIVAATVLAGELGTLCAVASGELGRAHARIARWK